MFKLRSSWLNYVQLSVLLHSCRLSISSSKAKPLEAPAKKKLWSTKAKTSFAHGCSWFFHGSTIVQLLIFHSKTTRFSSSFGPRQGWPLGAPCPAGRRSHRPTWKRSHGLSIKNDDLLAKDVDLPQFICGFLWDNSDLLVKIDKPELYLL